MIVDDKGSAVVAGFKISETSVANSESPLKCQLNFLK